MRVILISFLYQLQLCNKWNLLWQTCMLQTSENIALQHVQHHNIPVNYRRRTIKTGWWSDYKRQSHITHYSCYLQDRKLCIHHVYKYSGTWELGTPKGLWKTVLNSEVVSFLRYISMYWIDLGTEVVVLYSQVVPISQAVLKTGFTVLQNVLLLLTSSIIHIGNIPVTII